jgi:hypothetical protein
MLEKSAGSFNPQLAGAEISGRWLTAIYSSDSNNLPVHPVQWVRAVRRDRISSVTLWTRLLPANLPLSGSQNS